MNFRDKVAAVQKLLADMALYCVQCMRILPKDGGKPEPFVLNKAQLYVHARLEEQLRTTGKVRALILKGRQQGISTYIAARFYRACSMLFGKYAFIVAHEQKATDNLFKMVKRYHDHNPLAPSTGATNAKELVFDDLDSGYKLATAGSKDVGRSNTTQLVHGSEFAFWDNPSEHLAGLGNTVSDKDGTEIVLESTANGIGNAFHQLWQRAEAGEGEYIAIFVPWFWQEEYTARVPDDFVLTAEEAEYQKAYGLTLGQMAWKRNKEATYEEGKAWLFHQEYPAAPALAFQAPTSNPLISPVLVSAAQNSGYRDMSGPLVIGVDPSEGIGRDRTAIVFRRGRVVFRAEAHEFLKPMACAALLAKYYAEFQPDAIFIDRGAGAGIIDRLEELHVPCIGVAFGGAANDPERYVNKRAEMWWAVKDWLENTPVRLPRSAELAADLSAPGFPKGYMLNSIGQHQLESKQDMHKRGIRSPDLGDALALTFAEPVLPMATQARNSYGGQTAGASTLAGY